MMADLEQAKLYFAALYDPGQLFELVAIKDGAARRKVFLYPNDIDAVLEAINGFEEAGWNLYASALPLDTQDVGLYDRVWIDRDDPYAPWPFNVNPHWEGEVWPHPTTLVRTSEEPPYGQRWQAIWRLETPVSAQEGRELIKRIAKAGIGDPSVHDPRRVLRIPGVWNAKRGTRTRLLKLNEGMTTIPEEFFLPEDEPMSIDTLLNTEISAPYHVLGEWLEGATEGDRARKAFVVARFLRSCKVAFSDAVAIVNTGAKRSTPPLSDDEVMHAVKSAYKGDR